jgi:hypothetical protein
MMRPLLLPFSLLVALVVSSCQTSLKPSGYLGSVDTVMKKEPSLPFSRSWKNPEADLASYTRLEVRPMRTKDLRELRGVARINVRNATERVRRDAETLATLGTRELAEELGRSPNRKLRVTTQPSRDAGTLLVETNLVEVEPGRPSMQLLNFFVPFTSSLNRPAIGIEGRLVDANSGEVLFAFSDLERAEISFFDLQRFSYYGVQRRELKRWGSQLREVVESNGRSLVRDAFPVQIVNW